MLNIRFEHNNYSLLKLILSFGFSGAYLLTPIFREGSQELLEIWRFPVGIFVFYAIVGLLTKAADICNKWNQDMQSHGNLRAFIICSAVGTIIGIFYLSVFYPGTGMYDTLAILTSESFAIGRQHPWFYVMLTQLCVKFIFLLGGGYEEALVALSLIQILGSSIIYSYCLIWLRNKGINRIVWWVLAVFYIFTPFLNIIKVNIFKDIPYSLILLLWIPLLYECWKSNGIILTRKATIIKICILLILSLLRNNGIYVSFFILLCMLICYRSKIKSFLIFGMVLLLTIIGSVTFEKSNNIVHLFKETVGIPLQQMAGVVYYDGEISQEQIDFINQVIPTEFIKENYNPYSADKLKWGGAPLDNNFLNEHKREFLQVWLELLPHNLDIYVNVYLRTTYGFWSLDNSERSQRHTTLYVEAWKDWFEEENVNVKNLWPSHIQNKLEALLIPLTRYMGAGTAFWIFIMIWLAIGFRNGGKSFLIGVPIIGNWLTIMISTPVAYQWRYVLCIAMAIPLILGILFLPNISVESQKAKNIESSLTKENF